VWWRRPIIYVKDFMTTRNRTVNDMLSAWLAGFLSGILVLILVLLHFQAVRFPEPPGMARAVDPLPREAPATEWRIIPSLATRTSRPEAQPRMFARPPIDSDDIAALRQKKLLLPLTGLKVVDLRNSFDDARAGHKHEAIDILAPRNTPVLAIEDGKIVKLWKSKYGGITIYQFDPSSTYAYYYAHLEKYHDSLKEGMWVKKGQVIGYVGTSGNAPPNTPHLHFTIFKLTKDRRWWEGAPVNPYLIYQPAT
jgi:murein DD-endopeptidase MepM/ murein hydrolase activator NlpD